MGMLNPKILKWPAIDFKIALFVLASAFKFMGLVKTWSLILSQTSPNNLLLEGTTEPVSNQFFVAIQNHWLLVVEPQT